jgi:hypothetical protein
MKMSATIKVEFEAHEGQPENVLRAALQRGLGESRRGIEYGVRGSGQTGIVKSSTRAELVEQSVS